MILVVGVNGVGKTTTIGKLANQMREEGKKPLICAADTFRAAAVDQLQIWADRAGVDIVRAKEGSDPAAVVFDAMTAAKSRSSDVVLVDTAGRLHTRTNLMNELDKIRRVASREIPGAPHEVLLVLDATVGQNGLAQAREFTNVAGVTGIVLTKLDGTAKGGIAVAIAHDLKLPIRYVGVGEGGRRSAAVLSAGIRRRDLPGKMVTDADHMRRALFHARRGEGVTTPNPMVGAVVVTPDGVVVGYGRHPRAGEAHAEVFALDEAGERARGATLYVTLEPCCHFGRTGPCTRRIIAAGIRRVVAAMRDPNPLVSGKGFDELRAGGIEVDVGLLEDEAARLESRVCDRADRRAADGDRQGGDQHRFAHRGGARRAHAVDVARSEPADAAAARVGGRHRRRLGHAAGRRPGTDGARLLSSAAPHSRGVRSAAAERRLKPGCYRRSAPGRS